MTLEVSSAKPQARFQVGQGRKRSEGRGVEWVGAGAASSAPPGAPSAGLGTGEVGRPEPGGGGWEPAASWAGVWATPPPPALAMALGFALRLVVRLRKGSEINEAGGGLGCRWRRGAWDPRVLAWGWGRPGPRKPEKGSQSGESRYLSGNHFFL